MKNGVSYYNPRDNKIYIVGGWDEKETIDKIFKYDPKTQETSFVSFLPHKVEGHTVNVIGDNMFIIGGFDSYGVTSRIMRVDLKTMETEVLKDVELKYSRENHTSQVLNSDTIIVAGGWNGHEAMN